MRTLLSVSARCALPLAFALLGPYAATVLWGAGEYVLAALAFVFALGGLAAWAVLLLSPAD